MYRVFADQADKFLTYNMRLSSSSQGSDQEETFFSNSFEK